MPDPTGTYERLKERLRLHLSEWLGNGSPGTRSGALDREAVVQQVRELVSASQRDQQFLVDDAAQARLVDELANELLGVGPLEPLLLDPEITEIMVNGPSEVFVERQGRLTRSGARFEDADHLIRFIERLLDRVGLSVSPSEPCVDASLPDGTRINIIIPPLVLNGPVVTIRKKSRRWTLSDLLALGSLSPEAAEFLQGCVKAKVNLIVSGGTSTGKTTLVNVLSSAIPQEERVISIENVAELELPDREHWIRLVARIANVEGRGEVSLRMLVKNALRMRPDRIILGEARGGEALDVVQAMHTGHEGVITVLHGNSPQAALERLQTLMLMSGLELPPQACQMQIASAVDAIVHMGRFADGSRRVSSIAQLHGGTRGGFQLEELFTLELRGYRPDGALEGALRSTGVRPKFLHKFQVNNVPIPKGVA